jgi:alkylation response protein AidB-like acyl-CoA dehydrogenase
VYFDLTDEQQAIKSTAHDFLAARYGSERIRALAETEQGFEQADWQEMAELGWPGLALPEEWGGQGLGIVDLAVLFEEMGYAVAPSPLLSTTYVGLALALCGSEDQRERHLRPLASGEKRGAPAIWDAGTTVTPGAFTMDAAADGDDVVLDGEKILVPDADAADFLLVATDHGKRHIVDRGADGVTITAEPSIDLTRRLYSVRFDGVRVAAADTLPAEGHEYQAVFLRVCVALSAESTGVAQRTMEMAVEYAKDRQQFGRPIGAYQAVSHRCAQMLLDVEGARSAVYAAAWAADADPEQLPFASSVAKASAADAGRHVTASAIQAHGGIGFTWEADVHWLFKRAHVDAALLRSARWHRARIARLAAGLEREPQPLAQR